MIYNLGSNALTSGVGVGDVNGDERNDIVVSYGGNRPNSKIGIFQLAARWNRVCNQPVRFL